MYATVPEWRAANLEQSKYVEVMGLPSKLVTLPKVVDAYGYNAIVKIAANTPIKTITFNSQLAIPVPYLFQVNSTAFEYDANGLLLGYYPHLNGTYYNCTNLTCIYVEMVLGLASNTIDEVYDQPTQVLDSNYDYRLYITLKDGNAQNDIWTDVTTDPSKYLLVDNTLTWLISDTYHTLVRSNKKILVQQYTFDLADGLMSFNLTNMQTILGVTTDREMEVPMGELDIFLNGYSLIKDLDYFMDFPSVFICNKEYLAAVTQQVVVRFKGLCNSDLSLTDIGEHGFVRNGKLSVDQRYTVRDDKVIDISVGGRLRTIDDLRFNEDDLSFVFDSSLNGKPYYIKDTIVPIRSLTNQDTYVLKDNATLVDTHISDYLTVKLGTETPEVVNPIIGYYKLYSPMIAKVMHDLLSGDLDDIRIKQQYNDDIIRDILAPYLYLLSTDPIYLENRPNHEYVIIHPHEFSTVIDLDIYQYTFVDRVIRLYASQLIELSNHARIV